MFRAIQRLGFYRGSLSAAVKQQGVLSTGPEAQMDGAGLPAVRGFRWSRGQDRDRTSGSHQDHFPRQGFCRAEGLIFRKCALMIVHHTDGTGTSKL